MPRPSLASNIAKSEALRVRLLPSEKAAFDSYCQSLGQSQGRVIRRLIRESIGTGPDYFDDGLHALHDLETAVRRVGDNLNQLVRAYHRGLIPHSDAVQSALQAITTEIQAVRLDLNERQLSIRRRIVPAAPEGHHE